MLPKINKKALVALFTVFSGGMLFALGDTPKLIDSLINYPNPFDSRREGTFISYQIHEELPVRVKIYDLFGYPVKEYNFFPGEPGARMGQNRIVWDGTDETGQKVSKGGYICQVIVQGSQPVRGIRKIGVIH